MIFCRPDQAAEIYLVSKKTIYRAMKEGTLEQGILRGRNVVKLPLEIQQMQEKGDRLLRPSDVAQVFQCSPSSVYRWFYEGKLEGMECLGGTLRLFESSVQIFAEVKNMTGEEPL